VAVADVPLAPATITVVEQTKTSIAVSWEQSSPT